MLVVRNGAAGFDVQARYRVAESPTWAHPVLTGNQLLPKDAESLTLGTLGD